MEPKQIGWSQESILLWGISKELERLAGIIKASGGGGGGGVSTVFTTTANGLVPAPLTVSGRVLSDNGTWIIPSSSGIPTSRILNINGNSYDLSTDREWRVAQADTGVLTFAGLNLLGAPAGTINIGAATGYVINNEGDPSPPSYTFVNYAGQTNFPIPVGIGTAHYVLLDSTGTIQLTTAIPNSAQRKTMMWLGKVSHPLGVITIVVNEPDYITSPQAFSRDLLQALGPYINNNVYPVPNGANKFINITQGYFLGDGINFVNSKTNPNTIVVSATPGIPVAYRTSLGNGPVADITLLPGLWESAPGVISSVGGGINTSTIQYLYAVPGQGYIMQYGQFTYPNLDAAIAAIGKEANTVYPNLLGNAILIAVLAVKRTATALNDLTQAQFFKADKIGQISSVGGSINPITGPTTIIISTISGVSAITTATVDSSGYGQDGRNVVIDNVDPLTFTCNGNVTASYARHSANGVTVPPTITFQAGASRTLISVDGTLVFNGKPGSTAALWTAPGTTIDYLRISNV